MIKGDIVLIPFPFTDFTGEKLRPALVLINSSQDITVCFITSQLKWKEDTDINLYPSKLNGIKKQSLIRVSKITTLDKKLAIGKLGSLSNEEITNVNINLRQLLKL
jgi:mRNA interferase MazF